MERLIKALGSLTEARYQGSYIGKILWEKQWPSLPVKGSTLLTIEGACQNFMRILVVLESEHGIAARLQVGLFLAKEKNAVETRTKKESLCFDEEQKWRAFSPAEIIAFVDFVGDYNEIHRSSHPVVPGLFLLQEIAKELPLASKIELRFLQPLYARQAVFLYKDKEFWRGYGPSGQVFSVKIRYFANSEE